MAAKLVNPESEIKEAYRRAYIMLLETMVSLRPTVFSEVRDILSGLFSFSRGWIQRWIPEFYTKGRERALKSPVTKSTVRSVDPRGNIPQRQHRADIETLSYDLYQDLVDSLSMVGRRVNDRLREVGLEETLAGRIQGQTTQDIKRRLADRLEEEGITGVTDSSGREWRPDTYAEMAARTTLTEAQNLGMLNQLEEEGVDLVRISEHASSCPICFPGYSRVLTRQGWKPIRDVAVGDLVLTHRGRWRPVTSVMSRQYSGHMVRVDAGRLNVEATPEHPFLTALGWVEAQALEGYDTVTTARDRVCSPTRRLSWPPSLVTYQEPLQEVVSSAQAMQRGLSREVLQELQPGVHPYNDGGLVVYSVQDHSLHMVPKERSFAPLPSSARAAVLFPDLLEPWQGWRNTKWSGGNPRVATHALRGLRMVCARVWEILGRIFNYSAQLVETVANTYQAAVNREGTSSPISSRCALQALFSIQRHEKEARFRVGAGARQRLSLGTNEGALARRISLSDLQSASLGRREWGDGSYHTSHSALESIHRQDLGELYGESNDLMHQVSSVGRDKESYRSSTDSPFTLRQIQVARRMAQGIRVYNISVGEDESYVCEGFVVHNCAKYEGRVYSISGRSERFPPLRGTAFSIAYHTIHPNCRHSLEPYSEEHDDKSKATRQKSNRPFEDDRTEAEKRAYQEQQNRKRKARERRRKAEEGQALDASEAGS